ncbi:MAG: right-handed parallel beta-helix repeat-containing protein [Verrucomicrobia bacterium]|nr:right-handed parallel beta-helix repeat-containing protein [Verrucomicrobiota bacterium]
MKSSLRPSALQGVLEKLHPPSRVRDIVIPEPEDGSTPENAYLTAVRKAHRDGCIILPPGNYPAPKISRSLAIRAARPGTVRFFGPAKRPAILADGDYSLWLSGIQIVSSDGDSPAVEQTRGCIILSNCLISGGIHTGGGDSSIYFENSRIERAEVGLMLDGGARAEILGTTVSGCKVGVSAEAAGGLSIHHSRIESSFRNEDGNPGAGLHADGTPVYCAGTLFIENQLGAHFIDCKNVEMLFCEFEKQVMGGLMMHGGGPLHMHGCVFAEQASKDYAHVTLDQVTTAAIDFCIMDASAGLDVQSMHGHLTQRSETPPPSDSHGDILSSVLAEIHQVIGMSASKQVMETLMHQAHAAIQRRKRGMPVPPLKFHCIFEGEEGSGRRQAAALLAKSLGTLGILTPGGKVVEAAMEDLLLGGLAVPQAVEAARGGILLLHASSHVERHDSRLSSTKSRETLRQVLAACGEDTILIFTGSRDSVRPIMRSSAETEELFRATMHFSLPSPPELAEMFSTLAADLHIRLTTKARIKLLLSLHMLDDRRDRRFLSTAGVAKLLDATQKRYFERCSRERNFELPLEAGDIDVPVEKNADAILQGQPVFVTICPECESENPWVPGQPQFVRCADCEHSWESGWGIWTPSSYYRRLKQEEDAPIPVGLPPHRGRAAISG